MWLFGTQFENFNPLWSSFSHSKPLEFDPGHYDYEEPEKGYLLLGNIFSKSPFKTSFKKCQEKIILECLAVLNKRECR